MKLVDIAKSRSVVASCPHCHLELTNADGLPLAICKGTHTFPLVMPDGMAAIFEPCTPEDFQTCPYNLKDAEAGLQPA